MSWLSRFLNSWRQPAVRPADRAHRETLEAYHAAGLKAVRDQIARDTERGALALQAAITAAQPGDAVLVHGMGGTRHISPDSEAANDACTAFRRRMNASTSDASVPWRTGEPAVIRPFTRGDAVDLDGDTPGASKTITVNCPPLRNGETLVIHTGAPPSGPLVATIKPEIPWRPERGTTTIGPSPKNGGVGTPALNHLVSIAATDELAQLVAEEATLIAKLRAVSTTRAALEIHLKLAGVL